MFLDEKDREILRLLSSNSRLSYSELARKIGLSDVAIIKRIRKLEQSGVIKKYTILVDPSKLGYKVVSITGIDVEPEHLFNVLNNLKEKKYIRYLALSSGDHDLVAIIWARDNDEAVKIHNEISGMEGVKRVCPAMILEVVKEPDP